jgi:hypothetical protein
MKENMKNDTNGVSRLLGHLAAEKKKTGIALCLIAVMAVMWVKVLTNKGPESVQAVPKLVQTEVEEQIKEAMKITYLNLSIVPGRDDLISRDFFASAGWQDFKSDEPEDTTVEIEEVIVAPADDSKEVLAIVTQHVRLQAIGMGRKPQAFINDKLMSVGETLVATDGAQMYECEVVEIRKNSVLIRCRDAEIVLKLVETAEGDG